MKIIKSDKRYKHFTQGYTFIAQFAWASMEDKAKFASIMQGLKEIHGEQFLNVDDDTETPVSIWSKRRRNPNYIIEQNKSAKRRRIYLKNETDVTLALLKV